MNIHDRIVCIYEQNRKWLFNRTDGKTVMKIAIESLDLPTFRISFRHVNAIKNNQYTQISVILNSNK